MRPVYYERRGVKRETLEEVHLFFVLVNISPLIPVAGPSIHGIEASRCISLVQLFSLSARKKESGAAVGKRESRRERYPQGVRFSCTLISRCTNENKIKTDRKKESYYRCRGSAQWLFYFRRQDTET